MVRAFILLAAVELVLVVLALIGCLSADRVRGMPRALWFVVILLVPLLGPIAYLVAGRPPAAPREGAPPRRPARRPVAPDDDPDFLRSMDAELRSADPEQSRRDRELLAQWERELRERELRNGDED